MKDLNFNSMTDAELSRMEYILELELDAAIVNMVESERLNELESDLDAIFNEKERRNLNSDG